MPSSSPKAGPRRALAASFDAVTAFMSLMDVADPERTLREVARVLRPGGFVQFSVVHPILSAWVHPDHPPLPPDTRPQAVSLGALRR